MTAQFREHKALAAIVFLFWIYGLLYDSATPIFEGLDEVWHYAMVKRLADEESLPVVRPGEDSAWRQQGTQPPLYYAVLAAATAWVDTSDYSSHRMLSSTNLTIGLPEDSQGEKFWYYHTRAEDFPYHRTTLAVHFGRWISLLMAAGVVALAYALARELLPDWPQVAALTAAIVAFNPGFLFISAQVNNDNLTNVLGAATALLLARLWQRGFSPQLSIGLALLCGLAALTKLNGLLILLVIGVTASLRAARRRALKQFLSLGLLSVGVSALIAGWWYARNLVLYGSPLPIDIHSSFVTTRALTFWEVLRQFWGHHVSYWGVFGLSNIVMAPQVYQVYAAGSWLAFIGVAVWTWRNRRIARSSLTMPVLQGAILMAGTLVWTRTAPGPAGRLTYPAIGAISLLAAIGLLALAPRRWCGSAVTALSTGMAVIAFATPFAVIRPTYARALLRPPLARDSIAAQRPLQAHVGDAVKLHGFDVASTAAAELQVTLHWEVLERSDEDLIVFVHLFDVQGDFVVGHDSVPMGRTYPSAVWSPGEWLADTHTLSVTGGIQLGEYRLAAGMYRFSDNQRLPASDANGRRFADDVIPLGRTITFPP